MGLVEVVENKGRNKLVLVVTNYYDEDYASHYEPYEDLSLGGFEHQVNLNVETLMMIAQGGLRPRVWQEEYKGKSDLEKNHAISVGEIIGHKNV